MHNQTNTTPPLFRGFVHKYKDQLLLAALAALFVTVSSLEKHWEEQDQKQWGAVHKYNKSNTATTDNLQLGQPSQELPTLTVSEQLFYNQQAEIKAIQQEDQALRDLLVTLNNKTGEHQ